MTKKKAVPIIGIGASAGGISALKGLFHELPADTGAAYVVIQHLDPKAKSLAAEILARSTPMPVVQAADGMRVEPNHVYVIPPNAYIKIERDVLHLGEAVLQQGLRMPIDTFLCSLAERPGPPGIAIILSGTGTDGTIGIRSIAGEGGFVIVQSPESAEYDGMPSSAVATGVADVVCTVDEMSERLRQYLQHPFVAHPDKVEAAAFSTEAGPSLGRIISLLKQRTDYDFSGYKQGTLERRIARRMSLANIGSVKDYLSFLEQRQEEIAALQQDLLVKVTEFFRDDAAFDALDSEAITEIIKNSPSDHTIRVWVPACATGEEAYTLAMLFMERLESSDKHCSLQIFATDLDDGALAVGRNGLYPENALSALSSKRLARFFNREDHHYRARKSLRECITFARQNLIYDPPFSKIDLISCRNLLIYLKPETQRRILGVFHFALNADGFLFLGSAESIPQDPPYFNAINKQARLFQRSGFANATLIDFPGAHAAFQGKAEDPRLPGANSQQRLQRVMQQRLLHDYAPAAVLVDTKFQVLYFFGDTSPYLEQPPGAPTQDLMALALPELRQRLRHSLEQAVSDQKTVQSEPIQEKRGEGRVPFRIVVKPQFDRGSTETLYMVIFEASSDAGVTTAIQPPASAENESLIEQMEHELETTKAELQRIIEENETFAEDMQASNEEAISINEELQSSNEELESSKEELQSMNEELTTLNNQLKLKVDELARSNEDLDNLLASIDIATLFLDSGMCIRRFTPATRQLFNLIVSDIGRPISDIRHQFEDEDHLADAQAVLRDLVPLESEIKTKTNRSYLRRIVPYRTRDDHVEGVVITFTDITRRVTAEQHHQEFTAVVHDSDDAIILLDTDGAILSWNRGAQRMYGWSEEEALTMNITDLAPAAEREVTRAQIRRVAGGERVDSIDSLRIAKDGSQLDVWLTISPLYNDAGQVYRLSSTGRDVTELKRINRELSGAKTRAEEAAAVKARFLATASHDLRQPLQAIGLWNSALLKSTEDAQVRELLGRQKVSLEDITQLLNSLLDTVKLDQGGVKPAPAAVNVQNLLVRLAEEFSQEAEEAGIDLIVAAEPELFAMADPGLLTQLLRNLISNALRYTEKGRIQLRCKSENGDLRLSVIDSGIGIAADQLQLIFDDFHQIDDPNSRQLRRGMGLGLSIVQRIASVMQTGIEVESTVGQGSCFSFRLPSTPAPAEFVPTPEHEDESTGNGISLLVIEDEPEIQASMQTLLGMEGFEVATASTPEQAFDAATTAAPDLIISDFYLEGCDCALDIVQQIRASANRTIPALLISGDTSASLGGLENAELLIKPVHGPVLLAAIRRLTKGE